jgi:hypothetical protein
MRTLPLFLLTATLAFANIPATSVGRITLLDGRVLKNVVIRTYDSSSSKVLLISDGKAMLIPLSIIPPPYAESIREAAAKPSADLVQTTPVPVPSDTVISTAPPAETVVVKPTPAPIVVTPAATVDPVEAHMNAATAHVRRYYKFEYRTGSNAISVTDSDIAVEETEAVEGWSGRYRTTGKVYLEVYDSVGGGSFRRTTGKFEVLTEQKPGELIKVIDFTRK